MSRRGESGAGRLKQESRETPLLDHINDPLNQPEIGEIIMSGSRQVQRRCNRKSKSACSLTHSVNPATDLNEVEVEKRRRLRLHKRRSLGFSISPWPHSQGQRSGPSCLSQARFLWRAPLAPKLSQLHLSQAKHRKQMQNQGNRLQGWSTSGDRAERRESSTQTLRGRGKMT